MPHDLVLPMILAFVAAIGVVTYEMRASFDAPVCAKCVHCRLLAAERTKADEGALRWRSGSVGERSAEDRDRDDRPPKR